MKTGRYQDFKGEEPNTVWTFVKDPDGNVRYQTVVLKHLIAGDTDSSMNRLPESISEGLTTDEAVEIADYATEMVNETYPEFGEMAFNVPRERAWMFNSNREKVSDSSFFSTKKRYAMRVVDNEGKRQNRISYTGLEIVKSDTTEAEKQILTEIVDRIIDGQSGDEVKAHIADFKERFKTFPIRDIVKPSSVKTLGKATEQYRSTGSTKGLHYAAKAALMWNLSRQADDPEIYPGEKVGILNVRGMPYNAIAFPIDILNFPDWFNDIPVDYKTMWKKTEKKITNYISVMKWDNKSMRQEKRHNLFGF